MFNTSSVKRGNICDVLQADQVDADTLELVQLEMTELLEEFGFDAQRTPIVSGSALCALEDRDPELGEQSIRKLLSAVDEYIVPPSRDLDSPFVLPVEKAFTVHGRGTVAIGTLQCGVINKGDMAELIGYGNQMKTAASDVQVCSEVMKLTIGANSAGTSGGKFAPVFTEEQGQTSHCAPVPLKGLF